MPLLADEDARALSKRFEGTLVGPVTMHLFVESPPSSGAPGDEPCESCRDALAITWELAAMSDRLDLRVHDLATSRTLASAMNVDRAPTLIVRGAARGSIRFLGTPAGYEFTSLVVAIEAASRGTAALGPEARDALASLSHPVVIRVFVTPTCPYCPRAAAVAQQLAVESQWITAEIVQVNEFPDLGLRYHVHGVPKVVVNDAIEFVGAQPETAFVDALLSASAPERASVQA